MFPSSSNCNGVKGRWVASESVENRTLEAADPVSGVGGDGHGLKTEVDPLSSVSGIPCGIR